MSDDAIRYKPTVSSTAPPPESDEEIKANQAARLAEVEPVELKGRLLVVDTAARLERPHLAQIARTLGLVVLRRERTGFGRDETRRLADAFPELLVRLRSDASPTETSEELVDEVGEVVDRVLDLTLSELRERAIDDDRRAAKIAALTSALSESLRAVKLAREENALAKLSARVEQLEAERAAMQDARKDPP